MPRRPGETYRWNRTQEPSPARGPAPSPGKPRLRPWRTYPTHPRQLRSPEHDRSGERWLRPGDPTAIVTRTRSSSPEVTNLRPALTHSRAAPSQALTMRELNACPWKLDNGRFDRNVCQRIQILKGWRPDRRLADFKLVLWRERSDLELVANERFCVNWLSRCTSS